jgi:hypothetical protein
VGAKQKGTKKPFTCVPIWFRLVSDASATAYEMPLMHLRSDVLVIAPSDISPFGQEFGLRSIEYRDSFMIFEGETSKMVQA